MSLKDRFSSVIKNAQKNLERLKSTADRIKQNENIKVKLSVQDQQRLERLKAAIEQARTQANKPLSVRLRDQASTQINKLRSEINALTGKAHTIIANVKVNGAERLKGLQGGLNNALNSGLMASGAAFAGLGAVGGLTYGGVSAFQSQMDFEKQMSSVKAILSGSYKGAELDAAMTALTEKAEEMGATTKFTAKESAEALYYMGMAGFKAEQMTAALPTVLNLAAAGNESLGRTSDIVTDAMTAFGLKAGEVVNLNGRVYESTEHFGDMFGATITNANTDIGMMGDTLKYAAPLIQSLYADKTAAERMQGAQDTMLVTGLMANAGVKDSQAGTAIRSLVTRLASQNRNAYFAQNALGIDVEDANGDARRFVDIVKDLRTAFKEGVDMDRVAETFEQFSGEKIHAETRRKLDDYYSDVQARGGKMGGLNKDKMASMLAGQEAMSGWLAVLLASDEDFDKLASSIENAEGTLDQMAAIQLDNLAGSFTLLASAWDAFQRNLVKGDASAGLRAFVDSLTDTISKANELFKDGIQIGDFGKIAVDIVSKLKNKFLELDGIGSLLAGGALFIGLKKIASLALSVKDSISSLAKVKTAGDVGAMIRGQNASSVGTMNVKAGVVNLSGNIKGLNSRAATNQARVDEYYRRRQQITGQTSTTTTPSRFKGAGTAAAGAGAFAALFGALDVLATKNNSEYQTSLAKEELAKQEARLQFLKDNNAGQEQIAEQVARIREAESHIQAVAEENRVAEQRSEFGAGGAAIGSIAGAVIGAAIPVIGPLVGSMIGGMLGEYAGSKGSDLWEEFKKKHYGGDGGAATAQGSNVQSEKSFGETVREKLREDKGAEYTESTATSARIRHAEAELENDKVQTEQRKTALDSQIEKATGAYSGSAKTYNAPEVMQATFADGLKKFENAVVPKVATVQLNKKAATPVSTPKFDTSSGFSNYSTNLPKLNLLENLRERFSQPKDYSQPQATFNAPQFAPPVQILESNLSEKLESVKSQISSFAETFSAGFETVKSQISSFAESFTSIFESISSGFSSFTEGVQSQITSFGESFSAVGESFSSLFESIATGFTSFAENFSTGFESISAGITSFSQELVTSFIVSFETLSVSASSTFASLSATIQGGVESARAMITAAFSSAAAEVQGIWGAIPGFFGGVFGSLGGIAAAAGSAIAAGINSGIGMIQGAWEALSGWLSAKISSLASMAASAAASIGIGSNAKGTSSWQGGFTQVNEHGGELIILPNGQTITPYQTVADIAHNAKGTSYFEGGWSEVNEHGGEIMYLPTGTRIIPHATTVRLLRQELKEKLNADETRGQRGSLDAGVTNLFEPNATATRTSALEAARGTTITTDSEAYAELQQARRNSLKKTLAERNVETPKVESVDTPALKAARGTTITTDSQAYAELQQARRNALKRTLAERNVETPKVETPKVENVDTPALKAARGTTITTDSQAYAELQQARRNSLKKTLAERNSSTSQKAISTDSVVKRTTQYDSLGNLQGVDIPDFNKITPDDSLLVKRAKQEAQLKYVASRPVHQVLSETGSRPSQVETAAENERRIGIQSGTIAGSTEISSRTANDITGGRRGIFRSGVDIRPVARHRSNRGSFGYAPSRFSRNSADSAFINRNDNLARIQEAQKYLPTTGGANAQRIPQPSNFNRNDNLARIQEAQRYLPRSSNSNSNYRSGVWNSNIRMSSGGVWNNDLQTFNPQLPRLPDIQPSRSYENNSTTNNSTSGVNFNFGGVNISNGMDFDNFSHKLMNLFTQGTANSVQF